MARKTTKVVISREGRDKGKIFVLTEMSSAASEDWAMRAMFLAMQSGVEISDEIAASGLAGLANIGLASIGKVPFDLAKPLLDQMMDCVQLQPDRNNAEFIRPLEEDDIEEVATRLQLRHAVFNLHTDFFTSAAPSTQGTDAAPTSPA
jgi:hypothetical protein